MALSDQNDVSKTWVTLAYYLGNLLRLDFANKEISVVRFILGASRQLLVGIYWCHVPSCFGNFVDLLPVYRIRSDEKLAPGLLHWILELYWSCSSGAYTFYDNQPVVWGITRFSGLRYYFRIDFAIHELEYALFFAQLSIYWLLCQHDNAGGHLVEGFLFTIHAYHPHFFSNFLDDAKAGPAHPILHVVWDLRYEHGRVRVGLWGNLFEPFYIQNHLFHIYSVR